MGDKKVDVRNVLEFNRLSCNCCISEDKKNLQRNKGTAEV